MMLKVNESIMPFDKMSQLEAALFYAQLGWLVFPIWPIRDGKCGCGNTDCKSPGKHPIGHLTGDWRNSATTDIDTIHRWWGKYPETNIATPDHLRIDVDDKENALEYWYELVREHGIPDTPRVNTPSGGEHWYFEPPSDWKHSNETSNLPKGIDVRGHGTGYTLLPPSNHLNGQYQWEVSSSPDQIPVTPLPELLAQLLKPSQTQKKQLVSAAFSRNGTQPIDLAQFKLSELIKATIQRKADPNTDRSAIDQSVINSLLSAGASNDDIRNIYEQYPIGTAGKYGEKGKYSQRYLAHSIAKARQFSARRNDNKSQALGSSVPPVSITEKFERVDSKFLERCLKREELGDAELGANIFQNRVVYDHSETRGHEWNLWTGNNFTRDNTARYKHLLSVHLSEHYVVGAITFAKKAIAAKEAGELGKAGKYDELNASMSNRARQLRKKARLQNVLDFAASLQGISGSEWDAKPLKLVVANGVIDLSTGELFPGNPQDYLRTAAPTLWHGLDEVCPRFEKFLHEIMAGELKMVSYLQRLFGYGISGLTSEHVFPILWGESGRNGKDTLLEAVGHALGPLAGAVSKDAILDAGSRRAGGAAEPHIYDLRGKRLVWASEPHEGARLDTAQVKLVTGGGRLKARPLYGSYVEWTPTHLVMLVTNPRPHAAADDKALWSRIQLIPFTERFVDKPQGPHEHLVDKQLKDKLHKEASGILAWLVRGFLEWKKEGLNPPKSVTRATDEYQKEEDTLSQFIEGCCTVEQQLQTSASQLFNSYRAWCESYGVNNPMNGRVFGMKMAQRFDKKRTNRGNIYKGIGLQG